MKKSSNLWRIIWVVGIYAILGAILYLVVLYKVKWEHKDLNTYLYLYDCNNNLCTSTVKQDEYYNKVVCEDDICPYIKEVIDNKIILKRENKSWIYDYIDNKIINDTYIDYKFLRDNQFVFTDSYNKQGVLDINDGVIVQSDYDYINDFNGGIISYKQNNLYGITSIDGKYNVDANYRDIVLINDKLFAGMKDNNYYLYSYDNISESDTNKYNYIYSYGNVIFVFNNNKINILDTNLDSLLLMKIDSFYEYTTGKERESLKFYFDGENICFNVFVDENKIESYKFNISQKKLV